MFRHIVLLVSMILSSAANLAAAGDYQFQKIVDSTSMGLDTYPQIDASGAVYFEGVIGRSSYGVFRGTPGSVAPIVDTTGQFEDVEFQSVNELGDVAFYGNTIGGPPFQLYRTIGGTPVHVSYPSEQFDLLVTNTSRAWINNAGVLAYPGRLDLSSDEGIASSLIPSQMLVPMGAGQEVHWLWDGHGLGDPPGAISLDNSGNVAFWGNGYRLFQADPSGALTLLYDNSATQMFYDVSPLVEMNDQGTIAFAGVLRSNEEVGIFTLHNGSLTLFADTSGLFSYDYFSVWDINDSGEIVLQNTLDNGVNGIFDGANPVTDRVIMQGDALDGSSVKNLRFYNGLNDAGQIAFWAQLTDGRSGIFRADPFAVPEPSTIVLSVVGGIALLASANLRRSIRTAVMKRQRAFCCVRGRLGT